MSMPGLQVDSPERFLGPQSQGDPTLSWVVPPGTAPDSQMTIQEKSSSVSGREKGKGMNHRVMTPRALADTKAYSAGENRVLPGGRRSPSSPLWPSVLT